MSYSLPELYFQYDELEPIMTHEMVDVHYNGHHATYVNNLNKLLADNLISNTDLLAPEIFIRTIDDIALSNEIKNKIKFNYGGYWNHKFFWNILTPVGSQDNVISRNMQNILCENFNSLETFYELFKQKSLGIFGSGWCWLCIQKETQSILKIVNTANQDLVQFVQCDNDESLVPLLTLDIWEHAYYLKYKNRKSDFVDDFWNIVNWNAVERNYYNAIM